MEEDQLAIDVCVHELVVHLRVDVGRDAHVALIGGREHGLEWNVGDGCVAVRKHLGALLRQAAGSDEVSLRIGSVPCGEEDVVLEIGRGDV